VEINGGHILGTATGRRKPRTTYGLLGADALTDEGKLAADKGTIRPWRYYSQAEGNTARRFPLTKLSGRNHRQLYDRSTRTFAAKTRTHERTGWSLVIYNCSLQQVDISTAALSPSRCNATPPYADHIFQIRYMAEVVNKTRVLQSMK
jgi:hypothetical protein